jgi:hypothetical protein
VEVEDDEVEEDEDREDEEAGRTANAEGLPPKVAAEERWGFGGLLLAGTVVVVGCVVPCVAGWVVRIECVGCVDSEGAGSIGVNCEVVDGASVPSGGTTRTGRSCFGEMGCVGGIGSVVVEGAELELGERGEGGEVDSTGRPTGLREARKETRSDATMIAGDPLDLLDAEGDGEEPGVAEARAGRGEDGLEGALLRVVRIELACAGAELDRSGGGGDVRICVPVGSRVFDICLFIWEPCKWYLILGEDKGVTEFLPYRHLAMLPSYPGGVLEKKGAMRKVMKMGNTREGAVLVHLALFEDFLHSLEKTRKWSLWGIYLWIERDHLLLALELLSLQI